MYYKHTKSASKSVTYVRTSLYIVMTQSQRVITSLPATSRYRNKHRGGKSARCNTKSRAGMLVVRGPHTYTAARTGVRRTRTEPGQKNRGTGAPTTTTQQLQQPRQQCKRKPELSKEPIYHISAKNPSPTIVIYAYELNNPIELMLDTGAAVSVIKKFGNLKRSNEEINVVTRARTTNTTRPNYKVTRKYVKKRKKPEIETNTQELKQKDDTEETTAQPPTEAPEIETDTQELERIDDTEETITKPPEEIPERTKKYAIDEHRVDYEKDFERAIALQDATAETVADAFLKEFICIFSCPQIILSDQGTNFTSKVFVNLAKAFKIKTVTTTAYRPSSKGSLERSHHSLAEYLKTVAGKNKEWDDILEMAMFSYNTSVHEAHQFQPFQLVFGKLPTLPTAETIEKSGKIVTYTDYVRKLCKTLSEIKSIAREKLIDAKLRNKFYYDRKTNAESFKPGDYVYLLKGG
ncbi:unnamed protein product [Trichogramma brassicae]|uniref:Integrase catalytic domain-containing protein n=1 Tax=Trichogramma brassicae TaxID=86971 RepID=A0A6H5ISK7_9HYME|nr:unnamed protein product [Trichogramma brassicae]